MLPNTRFFPFLPLILAGGTLATAALAETTPGAAGEKNIALGASYKVEPARALARNSPKGALTNGQLAGKPLWDDQERAVRLYGNQPFSITLDLKERQPIGGIAVSTAAGVATSAKDIFIWPGIVDIYVSDDDRMYHFVGELLELNDAQGKPLEEFGHYVHRKIEARGLKASGRYVKLVFAQSRTLLLDEIEVYRGEGEAGKNEGRAVSKKGLVEAYRIEAPHPRQVDEPAETRAQEKRERLFASAIRRRYYSDIDTLLQKANGLPGDGEAIRQRLNALKEQVTKAEIRPEGRNVLPVGDLGREILAVQAAIWRTQEHTGVTAWTSDHWGFLPWLGEPEWKSQPELKLELMKGEVRSASFNLSNAGEKEATVYLKMKGLEALPEVKVSAVEWTESPWRLAVASALPEVKPEGDRYAVTVPAGGTRQVWLNVTGGAQAGEVRGEVEWTLEGGEKRTIPLSATVFPIAFPERQALHHSGFECASNADLRRRYGVFQEVLPEFARQMRAINGDAPWTTRTEFAFGKFNDSHDYASPEDEPNDKPFRDWVTRLFPDAHRYHVALTVKTPDRKAVIAGCDYSKDPEGFQKRVNRWLNFWKAKVEANGLQTDKVYFKIIDEPGFNAGAPYAEDEVIHIWMRAIHQSGTGFKVFVNPIYDDPRGANQDMLKEADVLCLKYSHLLRPEPYYRDVYLAQKGEQEISIYECFGAPGHLYDPYSYFRLQAWMAWEVGATTMFYWNYADSGTAHGFIDSWNNGHNQWYYSPYFLEPTSVTTSKQVEAIREGVGEHELLFMLRAAADKARNNAAQAELVAKADALMKRIPTEVLGGKALEEPRWIWPNATDRAPADRLRSEALHLLNAFASEEAVRG